MLNIACFFAQRALSKKQNYVDIDLDYDFIVVGGGASGILGAQSFAEDGKRVLLLERGQDRSKHPLTTQMNGLGVMLSEGSWKSRTYSNAPVRSVIASPSGIVSHAANVLGGGPSVNMGILLYESREYWEKYAIDNEFPITNMERWMESHEWVSNAFGNPVPPLEPGGSSLYDIATRKTMDMYYSQNGPFIEEHNSIIEPGRSWKGRSLFDYDNGGYRNSPDQLLFPPDRLDTLTLKLNHDVIKIASPDENKICVQGRQWRLSKTMCPVAQSMPMLHWFVGCPDSVRIWVESPFSYCIPRANGGIVLAAGALSSPLILMESGIGPVDEVDRFPNHTVVDQVGRNLVDRLVVVSNLYAFNQSKEPRLVTVCGLASLQRSNEDPMEAMPDYSLNELYRDVNTEDPVPLNFPNNLFAPWEDMGGGDFLAGATMSSKIIFPPPARNDPNILLWTNTLGRCLYRRWERDNGDSKKDIRLPNKDDVILDRYITPAICKLMESTLDCLQHSRVMFTLESDPTGRGRIRLSEQPDPDSSIFYNNEINVHMPYLSNQEDRASLVESTKHLWQSFRDIKEFEEMTESPECPLPIIRSLASLLTGDLLGVSNTSKVKKELGLDGPSVLNSLLKKGLNLLVGQSTEDDSEAPRMLTAEEVVSLMEEEEEKELIAGQTAQAKAQSVINFSINPISTFIPWFTAAQIRGFIFLIAEDDDCEIPVKIRMTSLPPLPCRINDETAWKFVSTYSTSIWHWLGSLRRSTDITSPVNPAYQLRGVDDVFVIDASVLPHHPRMNPQITVMAGARYAAKAILEGLEKTE